MVPRRTSFALGPQGRRGVLQEAFIISILTNFQSGSNNTCNQQFPAMPPRQNPQGWFTESSRKAQSTLTRPPLPPAPIDLETQCAAPLPNSKLCARPLTCKKHSMSTKRAVAGRSAPFDMLLSGYRERLLVEEGMYG